jgi:hypothetical protein
MRSHLRAELLGLVIQRVVQVVAQQQVHIDLLTERVVAEDGAAVRVEQRWSELCEAPRGLVGEGSVEGDARREDVERAAVERCGVCGAGVGDAQQLQARARADELPTGCESSRLAASLSGADLKPSKVAPVGEGGGVALVG